MEKVRQINRGCIRQGKKKKGVRVIDSPESSILLAAIQQAE